MQRIMTSHRQGRCSVGGEGGRRSRRSRVIWLLVMMMALLTIVWGNPDLTPRADHHDEGKRRHPHEENHAKTMDQDKSANQNQGEEAHASIKQQPKQAGKIDPLEIEKQARRRAILFARAQKSDADTEKLVSGFDEKERGAVWYELGRIYTDGLGSDGVLSKSVERDLSRGIRYITRAAREYGYPHAQHRLSVAHASGIFGPIEPAPDDFARSVEEGGPSNDVRAMLAEHFAAMGGDIAAAMGLGYRYLYGYGTPVNCDNAVLYYEIAANAAIEEMETLKVLPPNERTRLLDGGGVAKAPRRRGPEADQQLVDYYMHTADKGDVGAQVALGKLYFHGSQGVTQDFPNAAKYFEMAAKGGDSTAAGSIGHMYAMGIGVKQNNETARRYFLQGEEHGDPASINGMGYLYMHGMGVEKNLDKAVKLLQKAAHEKGHSDAFFNLGLIYSGIILGTADDDSTTLSISQQALSAVNAAAAALNSVKTKTKSEAIATAARAAMAKIEAVGGMDPAGELPADVIETLQDLSKKARDLEKIVQQEVKQIMKEVAEAADGTISKNEKPAGAPSPNKSPKQGDGRLKKPPVESSIKPNLAKALKFFSLSAQTGHMGALHKIGQMYSQGISTGKSCTTAVHAFKGVAERGPWVTNLTKAFNKYKSGDLMGALLLYIHMAEIGYETAQSNAALLLEDGTCGNLAEDDCLQLAIRYYRHASKQGNPESSLKVGDAYYYGKAGLAVDFERAAKYYQAAAELRQPQAMFNLGIMHQHGVGLKQDFHLAKRFLDSAAESHADAKWPVNFALLGLYIHWWFWGDRSDIPFLNAGTPVGRSAGGGGLIESTLITQAAKVIKQRWNKAKAKVDSWHLFDDRGAAIEEHPLPDHPHHHQQGGGDGEGGGGNFLNQWLEQLNMEQFRDMIPAVDTILILLLSTAFLYVMRVRAQQQREAERQRREGGEDVGSRGQAAAVAAAPQEAPQRINGGAVNGEGNAAGGGEGERIGVEGQG